MVKEYGGKIERFRKLIISEIVFVQFEEFIFSEVLHRRRVDSSEKV